MHTKRYCNHCWAELPQNALGNRCPKCLLSIGLSDSLGDAQVSVPVLTQRFGDYDLMEEIARGGMGVVFKARQRSLNRIVALKLILSGQFASKHEVLRFRAEAEAAANLHHPNIVAIHESGEQNGQRYFSMEFVEGRNLAAVVRDGPLPPQRAARYVQVISGAIHYAHQQGILHRDLKPSNILIDAADQPRITDFGLAKRLDGESGLTGSGIMLGTPACMAPEQARGNGAIGPSSDVYSMGVILYDLVTGKPPFAAESLDALLDQVLNREPIPPRLLNSAVPMDLDTICLKCLEKEPADRYQSAQSLSDELERFLNGDPISARPIIATEFSQTHWADEKFGRRYREAVDFYLPDRPRLFQVLQSFFRFYLAGRRNLRVCDLGCGDGAVAAQMAAVDSTIHLTLMDASQEMLEAARQRFGERGNTRYVHAAFDAMLRRQIEMGPFDFIASAFAIHHLHLAEKAVLFQRILEELQPGGWFMNIDAVLPDQAVFSDWLTTLWRDQILELEKVHRPPQSYREMPELALSDPDNKFSALAAQLKALKAAGFVDVECHYRNGRFAIYTGRKP